MRRVPQIFDRLMPALLMATSVTLLTAGLLSYSPSAVGDGQSPEPELVGGDPLLTVPPGATPVRPRASPTPKRTAGETTETPASAPPSGSAAPSESATPVPLNPSATPDPTAVPPIDRAVATRIRITSLGIDLPLVPSDLRVRGNRDFYPLCDVAMFMVEFVQPGEPGATYIYGHAQRGMFAPLLKASERDNGDSMIRALVEVYTSDDMLHLYEISRVKRHATDLSLAQVADGQHILIMQTSEGPTGTVPKLQVAARPLSVVPAEPSEANPRPHPRVCLPG